MTLPLFESAEHDPTARGRALGDGFADGVHAAWSAYERLFAASGAAGGQVRELAERALEQMHAWAPALAAEAAGIARGAGLEAWQVGALNARTEVLAALRVAGRGECSTFVALDGDGPPRTVQTWDWHPHLRGGVLACRLTPRAGHHVHLFTEFGVVGKIGVNGAGLGLHFNILGHAADGGPPGVPVHVVARRVLDEATTLAEAVAIARSARVSASTVLTVATWDGERSDARCLELSPAGVAEVQPRDGVLLHTNHFVDPGLASGERMGLDDPSSADRLRELETRVPALRAAGDAPARAAALLSHTADGGPPLCCHPLPGAPLEESWETLATISLDLAHGRLEVHEGGPCSVDAAGGGWTTV